MALLLVVVIVALLAAIAIPFGLSMGFQERGARGAADRAHARYAATAARNRAVAATAPGWEGLEESRTAPRPFNTPFSDTPGEYSAGRAGRPVSTGSSAGARVEDEQGKINLRTAPRACIESLMRRIDARVDDVRRHLTEVSGRPAAWIAPQSIREVLPRERRSEFVRCRVDDATHLSTGTRVRVSGRTAVQTGEIVFVDAGRLEIGLKGVVEAAEADAILEIEQRHPLNINTASREALAACFEGLALREYGEEDTVTRREATRLADAMASRTFGGWEEFHDFLNAQVQVMAISANDRRAIALNAVWPTDGELAGTGTVPLTLQSWNIVTVAARAIVKRPNEVVAGECDLREIVELAPPGILRWRCRSQEDFTRVLDRGMARGISTGPALPGEWPIRDRSRGAWFTGLTGTDRRAAWDTAMHFGPANEGKAAGEGLVFSGLSPFQRGQVVCWPSGATELWFQAPAEDATIFDAGEEEWSNRILLTYEGNRTADGPCLRLRVKDASLERGFSQVVHRVRLTPKRWYHIGAFWKTTRNGGMMLTLDGMPVGDWRAVPQGSAQRADRELGVAVHLVNRMSPESLSIECDVDVGHFNSPGAIAIGQEVIEYQTAIARSFNGVTRGARGSRACAHSMGETIAPWGYTDFVVAAILDYTTPDFSAPALVWDRIPECWGRLKFHMGSMDESTTMIWARDPSDPREVGLGRGEMVLSVPTDSARGFPEKGWLIIGNSAHEIVRYTGRDDSRFTGLDRGLFGTPERDHFALEPVTLVGFYVDTNAGFSDPTLLCIGNEFLGPVQKVGTDAWIAVVGRSGGESAPSSLLRGHFWGASSTDDAHPAGSPVLPTFALEDAAAGRGDLVTLLQQDYRKREQAHIACAVWLESGRSPLEPPALWSAFTRTDPPFLLAALDRQVSDEVVADPRQRIRRFSRVIRFPSGELPFCEPAPLRIGVSEHDTAPGELGGWIDELRCTTAEYESACLPRAIDVAETELVLGFPDGRPDAPPPSPGELPVNFTPLDRSGGAILVDDELIGYVSYEPEGRKLNGLKRGYLGTAQRNHARGSLVYPLTPLAISALAAGVNAEHHYFLTADSDGFPEDGYFLVDRELVGWTKRGPDFLMAPPGCDFRGAFGTTPEPHEADALLYAMPWRFYDRYTHASDDTDLHWFEATTRATGARWKSIRWEEMFTGASVDIRVFVRFDRSGRWIHMAGESRRRKPGGAPLFYEFDDDRGGKLGDTVSDQLDVRVMFEYLEGAWAKGEWKESPQFRGFEVEYEQEHVVHRHEEK
ncbi:MAG: hypothetical protein HYY18_17090 [Planctomycetes bacterium]|nr:hypothetical protein [Planctomycetota bacterium]